MKRNIQVTSRVRNSNDTPPNREPQAAEPQEATAEPQAAEPQEATAEPQAPTRPQAAAEPQAPTRPQAAAEPQAPTRPQATPPNQKPSDQNHTTKQPMRWDEDEFRQNVEKDVDVLDFVQPFVMAHEGVKHWHDSLLTKVGLGEMNRKVWAIVDKMRDNSLHMLKRSYGRKKPGVAPKTAPKPKPHINNKGQK